MDRQQSHQPPTISVRISTIRRRRSTAASLTRPTCIRREAAKNAGLLLPHRDVGGVLVLHADNVVAGVDMQNLAGNTATQVGEQIERAAADILDAHSAP